MIARSQEKSIVSGFEADVCSVIADILPQAGTPPRWPLHGIGAQELAMHLLDASAGIKSWPEICLIQATNGARDPNHRYGCQWKVLTFLW